MTTKSLADYDRAIQLNPYNAIAYVNRGLAKYALGRNQEAITDYDRAIKLDPNYANAYKNRGIAKSNLGKNQDAI
ncbi:cag pathogenicity island protein Cag7, partial [filamentous cyanobacterium Phorm 46]